MAGMVQENCVNELRAAITDLRNAREAFDLVESEHVEAACYRLKAAELRVDALFRQYKLDFAVPKKR